MGEIDEACADLFWFQIDLIQATMVGKDATI